MFCLLQAAIGSEEETVHDSTQDALESGLRFGVYEVDCHADGSLCELGRGAMGVTYRATDTSLQRKVALKIIKADIAERSADARERFVREARAAAALRHEHIATVYQFGMRLETGQYFYAMELIEGETLDDRVHRAGPLDSRSTIGIAQQVTSALAAAEKHGLVHRDLKPANLMLINADDPEMTANDQTRSRRKRIRALRKSGIPVVKIIDFGLAKAFHSATDPKSLTHDRFVGTPAYASPEQFEHSALDVRSDIYSLGETLWFALTGKTAFTGITLSEIHRAQKSNLLPIQQLKAAHVPFRLRSLLGSMLAFEPASRPGTQELAARLQRCSQEARKARHMRVALTAAAAVVFGLSALLLLRPPRIQNATLNPAPEKSIAVLPFENLSPDPNNVYFTDGVQNEILNDLARVADLKVISRTSVMQYKSGGMRNLREVAKALGVAHIVEGTVQRTDNRVRVSAQLIDARTDTHIWGDHYDRDLADVFAIESELAEQIVSKLKARLSPKEKNAIEEQPTRDLVAHDLYTRAKAIDQAVIFGSDPKLADAAQLLEEAVARDPSFFDAHCLLASIYDQLYFFGIDPTPTRLALAEATVQTVFRLRPEAGEAHLASARHFYWGYRDYDRARSELTIAARALPNEPVVFELLGYIERRQGRWKESTLQLQRALELDPLNLSILQGICFTYERLRQFSEARAMLDRALRLAPKDIGLRLHRAAADLWWRADSKPLDLAIKTILREDPKAAESVADQRLYLALCERDPDEASKALTSLSAHGYYDNGFLYPHAFCEGLVARLCNDDVLANDAFTRSRAEVDRIVRQQPTRAETLSILGLIDAALGNKEEAIREGQRASELLPLKTDSINGEILIENLATIYAWTGERDLALAQLTIAAQVPGNLNYGYLRLHPYWDPLRGDPRFKEIVTSLAPGAKKP